MPLFAVLLLFSAGLWIGYISLLSKVEINTAAVSYRNSVFLWMELSVCQKNSFSISEES